MQIHASNKHTFRHMCSSFYVNTCIKQTYIHLDICGHHKCQDIVHASNKHTLRHMCINVRIKDKQDTNISLNNENMFTSTEQFFPLWDKYKPTL